MVSPFSVPHPHPLSRNPLWSPPPSQEAPSLSWGGEMTGSVGRSKSDQRHLARSVPGLRPGWKWGRGLERCGERNRYRRGKQSFRGERTAGWPGRKPASLGPRVTDKPLARALLRPGGLRSYRGLPLPPPRSPPLSHERPQLGKPRVHLLIWTWLSNPKPGTQGLTMNWILDGGEWRGGYTLHSDTSPGCTPETPGLTLPRVRACTGVSPEKQGPKRGPSSGQCRGVWMRTRGQ